MTVGDQDALEAMVGHALRDVQNKMQQMLRVDIDGTGKIHVVRLESIRDQGQQQHLSSRKLGGRLADTPDQEVIGIEG